MRVSNWRERLQVVLDTAHGKRFRWGRHDCFQFISRCCEAVTGVDHREFFGMYTTREGAELLLLKYGGARGILAKALGEPAPNKSLAGEGDIVLIDMGRGEQPAICMGLNSYAPGLRTLVPRPTLTAITAWIL